MHTVIVQRQITISRPTIADDIVWTALLTAQRGEVKLRNQLRFVSGVAAALMTMLLVTTAGAGLVLAASEPLPDYVVVTVQPDRLQCADAYKVANQAGLQAAASLATIMAPTATPRPTALPSGYTLDTSCYGEAMHLEQMWLAFCAGNQALAHDAYQQWLCNTALELSRP